MIKDMELNENQNLSRQDLMREKNKGSPNIKKNYFKKYKKKIIISIVSILILIILIIFINLLSKYFKFKEYEAYENKMNIYGFSKLYNNGTPKTDEKVTISEAVKVIIGSILNKYDINDIAEEKDWYLNSTWCEYAEKFNIVDVDINEDNYEDGLKYRDLILYFYNTSKHFKGNLSELEEINFKDIDKYSVNEQMAIKFLVNNKIINNKFNGNDVVFKGLLNEICVNYADRFNIVAINKDDKININKEKEPNNIKDYPYTLANVDKAIYELPFNISIDEAKVLPVDIYKYQKEYMEQMQGYSEGFFKNILNIDYETIDAEKFKEKIDPYVIDNPKKEYIDEYVKYVKDNKIKIKGKAKHISPAIYFDGFYFRVRLRLDFEIINSNTDLNLLVLDKLKNNDKKYLEKKYSIYVDYRMKNAINSEIRFMDFADLYDNIIDKENSKIELVGDNK